MRALVTEGDRGEHGFTLLEVIVSLMLLGLVLGLVGSGAQLLRGTGDRLAERSAALADLALLTGLLQERLGDAVTVDFGPAGRPTAAFDGTAERARFLTIAAPVRAGEPLVGMQIGAGANGGLDLVLAELAATDRGFGPLDDPDRASTRRFMAGLTGARLSYFGRKEGAAAASWHEVWRDEPRLPRAVRLALDHRRLDLPPLIVPLRQDQASLCASAEAPVPCPSP